MFVVHFIIIQNVISESEDGDEILNYITITMIQNVISESEDGDEILNYITITMSI